MAQERRDLAPVLWAWFRYEVLKMRAAINDALEHLGFERLSHPKDRPVAPEDQRTVESSRTYA
ncbi:MAG: hypothetical protein U0822_24700 [Anaerolineae bacterium]